MSGSDQMDCGGPSEEGKEGQAAGNKPEPASRQKNLHRIQQRKRAVLGLPYTKKLLKLAFYSKCQVGIKKPQSLICYLVIFRVINVSVQGGRKWTTTSPIPRSLMRVVAAIY